jgi:hypothetical protein
MNRHPQIFLTEPGLSFSARLDAPPEVPQRNDHILLVLFEHGLRIQEPELIRMVLPGPQFAQLGSLMESVVASFRNGSPVTL